MDPRLIEGKTIGIVGSPESVVDQMNERFDGVIDRAGLSVDGLADERVASLLERLRG